MTKFWIEVLNPENGRKRQVQENNGKRLYSVRTVGVLQEARRWDEQGQYRSTG